VRRHAEGDTFVKVGQHIQHQNITGRNPASAIVRKLSQASNWRANEISAAFLIQRQSLLEMQLVQVSHL